ncbi:hypothetical protein GCM10023238_24070 [Streptomyces heliomycini]
MRACRLARHGESRTRLEPCREGGSISSEQGAGPLVLCSCTGFRVLVLTGATNCRPSAAAGTARVAVGCAWLRGASSQPGRDGGVPMLDLGRTTSPSCNALGEESRWTADTRGAYIGRELRALRPETVSRVGLFWDFFLLVFLLVLLFFASFAFFFSAY